MYDIILFDLDDTLLDFKLSEVRSLQRLHEHYFSAINYATFEKQFKKINEALWKRVGARKNALQPKEVGYLRFSLLNDALQHAHDALQLAAHYETLLGQTTEWLPGAHSVVEFLHHQEKPLAIITNGISQTQRQKFARHELACWFTTLLISDELGISKPARKIFDLAIEHVLQQTGKKDPAKILMIGDSLTSDGHGAKNAAIDFCLVGPLKPHKNNPPIHHHIQSMQELPRVLKLETQFCEYLHTKLLAKN